MARGYNAGENRSNAAEGGVIAVNKQTKTVTSYSPGNDFSGQMPVSDNEYLIAGETYSNAKFENNKQVKAYDYKSLRDQGLSQWEAERLSETASILKGFNSRLELTAPTLVQSITDLARKAAQGRVGQPDYKELARKTNGLKAGYNKIVGEMEGAWAESQKDFKEALDRTQSTPNNGELNKEAGYAISLGGYGDNSFRVVYPGDFSGQTYDSHIVDSERNSKTVQLLAREAIQFARGATSAFMLGKQTRATVEKDIDDFVRAKLSPAQATKFKGVNWNSKSYPD
jgi:hypothetical protein